MTTASPTTTADAVELSTDYRPVFLSGNEVRDLDDDPYLTARDIWTSTEYPEHTCRRCGCSTPSTSRRCTDCYLEARGERL